MATSTLCIASGSSSPSTSRTQPKDSEHFQCDIMFVGVSYEWIFITHLKRGRGRRALQHYLVIDTAMCLEENNKGTSKAGTAGMKSMERNVSRLKKD